MPSGYRLSDEDLTEAVDAYKAEGTVRKAAAALGLSPSTMFRRLQEAAARGFTDLQLGKPPVGARVIGVSTLYGEDGKPRAEWVKTRVDQNQEDMIDAIKSAFDVYMGAAAPVAQPRGTDEDLATVYVVSDHHLGLYTWAAETGEDYDLEIGAELLTGSMSQLVAASPSSGTGIVLSLGDFFHSDSDDNRTRRSGASLDVDTRYAKVLETGVQLMITAIDLARQKHDKVIVRVIKGNHDPYASLALGVALAAFYHGMDEVVVDTSPSPYWWWRFGRVLLGATHGDMAKPSEMPGIMAAQRPREWGDTEHRYIYLGHVHSRAKGGENGGAVWETFQTLAPKDAWHTEMGYQSGRSMVAITHHRERGEIMRHTVSVPKGA